MSAQSIIERLREYAGYDGEVHWASPGLLSEAADRIEAVEASVEKYEAQIRLVEDEPTHARLLALVDMINSTRAKVMKS